MGAFHVVGEDFELRFGVDLRVARQQKRAIRLFGVGFLRIQTHENFAVENAIRLVVQNVRIIFVAQAVRHRVIHRGVIVDVLRIFANHKSVERDFAAFVAHHGG